MTQLRHEIYKDVDKNTRILMVDDSVFDRIVLARSLANQGFEEVLQADDGESGWALALERKPDIVILDMLMPGMDGREFCRRARAHPELKDTPIFALTGQTAGKEKEEIFACGASDYLAKPVDMSELMARMSVHIVKARLMNDMIAYRTRLAHELEMAAHTQRALLPSDDVLYDLRRDAGLHIMRQECFSSELGGDVWGVLNENNETAIYSADFTGHGVNAALNVFRFHAMVRAKGRDNRNAADYVAELNEKMYDLLPTGQFSTLFYGIIKNDCNELQYVTAGCPDGLVIRENGAVERLCGDGYLLGACTLATYPLKRTDFFPGDCLVLFSDALIERPDLEGNILSEDDVAAYFTENPEEGFHALQDDICGKYSPEWDDDLTLVACVRES